MKRRAPALSKHDQVLLQFHEHPFGSVSGPWGRGVEIAVEQWTPKAHPCAELSSFSPVLENLLNLYRTDDTGLASLCDQGLWLGGARWMHVPRWWHEASHLPNS